MSATAPVVLVHGGFVDGSRLAGRLSTTQEGRLQRQCCPESDAVARERVDATKRVIDAQDEPVILVGHSYGGAVISEAGNDPKVAALVYISAFAPDAGESVNTLIADSRQERLGPRSCRQGRGSCS